LRAYPQLRIKNDSLFKKFDKYQNEEKRTPNPDLRLLGIWVREREYEAYRLKVRRGNLKGGKLRAARFIVKKSTAINLILRT
jgi:hypothetical protein